MTATITAAQLREAADLIAPPGKWARNGYARDIYGRVVRLDSPDAAKWCAVGAIATIRGERGAEAAAALAETFGAVPNRESLFRINDGKGKAAAIAELRRLADLAEAREREVAR